MSSTHDSRLCCAEHARAGAGLPAIEPGMPTPAGTGLSRRSFLLRYGPHVAKLVFFDRTLAAEYALVDLQRSSGAIVVQRSISGRVRAVCQPADCARCRSVRRGLACSAR